MRVYILGIDGYIGWALAQYLILHGNEVAGLDNGLRRRWVEDVGGDSILPIAPLEDRLKSLDGEILNIWDATAYRAVEAALDKFQPDAVVCLAQQPSAPYSMRGPKECAETKRNNEIVVTNTLWAMKAVCPEAHLLQIGSLGEYGTPDVPIAEPPMCLGLREDNGDWKSWRPTHFPRQPSSFYHSAKVASTHDIECACRFWGLRATDAMQGVVYGASFEGQWPGGLGNTRFDVDECFGTAVNRFCAQAVVGKLLTVYGTGQQRRGFLPLRDSLQCLRLLLENPPGAGEYRCVNQFDEAYSIRELAVVVAAEALELGLIGVPVNVENPRVEQEDHIYQPQKRTLQLLGYEPHGNLKGEVRAVLEALSPHRDRIESVLEAMVPKTSWR